MKRNLLIAMSLIGIAALAQETHHVMWGIGENTAQFSPTISPGDTVMWMWTTAHPHTVTSQAGSTEAFDSGTKQGVGQTYSKLFTMVGANPYVCLFHAGMAGVITVEGTAGTTKTKQKVFNVWPNPVNDVINITAETPIERIEMYGMDGKIVMNAPNAGNSEAKIYTDNLAPGAYIVKITTGGKQTTVKVVKK